MRESFKEYKEILKEYFSDHTQYRGQIWEMAKTDLLKTYRGAALGWAWAFIKPIIRIFVYWFAIELGLKSASAANETIPYFFVLMTGMVPWFYMSDMLTGGPRVMRSYKYIFTKMKYPVTTIPTFFNISKMIINFGMTALAIIVLVCYGFYPNLHALQLIFYVVLMFIVFNGWGLLSGMLGAISNDFINLINSVTIAFFWLSGILFDATKLNSELIKAVLSWNPITIFVNGYRNSLLYDRWFWENPSELIHLAVITVVLYALAFWAYRKLRKDIPDVI